MLTPTNYGSKIGLLLLLLMVIAVIQVLPQVDLPDTAFHEDSAPSVAKSRLVAAPSLIVLPAETEFPSIESVGFSAAQFLSIAVHPANQSRSILFSALLC